MQSHADEVSDERPEMPPIERTDLPMSGSSATLSLRTLRIALALRPSRAFAVVRASCAEGVTAARAGCDREASLWDGDPEHGATVNTMK